MTQQRPKLTRRKIQLGMLESHEIRFEDQKKNFDTIPAVDSTRLFSDLLPSGLTAVVARFHELQIGDLLEPEYWLGEDYLSDSDQRILVATGAVKATIETHEKSNPKAKQNFDLKNSEAWFLSNFVWYYSMAFGEAASPQFRLPFAIKLGRLIEWWRWRREGFDKVAYGKRRSEASLSKASEARKNAASTDEPEWWDAARLEATDIHSTWPKKSRSEVARQLAKIHRHSVRQIQEVIKPVWER